MLDWVYGNPSTADADVLICSSVIGQIVSTPSSQEEFVDEVEQPAKRVRGMANSYELYKVIEFIESVNVIRAENIAYEFPIGTLNNFSFWYERKGSEIIGFITSKAFCQVNILRKVRNNEIFGRQSFMFTCKYDSNMIAHTKCKLM